MTLDTIFFLLPIVNRFLNINFFVSKLIIPKNTQNFYHYTFYVNYYVVRSEENKITYLYNFPRL